MSARELSEFEQVRARKLGQELTNRLAGFCECQLWDEEMVKVQKIRDDLEKMGFRVEWSTGFDMKTGRGIADVKLWLP